MIIRQEAAETEGETASAEDVNIAKGQAKLGRDVEEDFRKSVTCCDGEFFGTRPIGDCKKS